jgi:septum formation protein
MALSPSQPELILASSSPYRRELLARLGLEFSVRSPHVDETAWAGEEFAQTARRLAREKAIAIAKQFPHAVVIGSDQVAQCEGIRLDKPGTAQKALEQLLLQRGKSSEFYTAVCVAREGGIETSQALVTTRVTFLDEAAISDKALQAYIDIEKPFDCAGAAKSEGLGIALIQSIEGPDPTALIGLPLIALVRLLRGAGVSVIPGARNP